MSVNRCTVEQLREALGHYPDDMNVVVVRHPSYSVTNPASGPELDGIEHIETRYGRETWDIYKISQEGDYEEVLILSATPIVDLDDWEKGE